MSINNGLVTVADYEQFVGASAPYAGDRLAMVEDAIGTSSRWVEAHTGRQFHKSDTSGSPVATARYFDSFDGCHVYFTDAYSVTAIAGDTSDDGSYATAWSASNYQLLPVGGFDPLLGAVPYTALRAFSTVTVPWASTYQREGLVRVTALWGWTSVPDPVQRATLTLAQDIVRDPEARFGGLTVTDVGILGRSTNPRVMQLLAPYVRVELTVGIG